MSQKLRMEGKDYSRPGWYFVTLGADYHKHLFGEVFGGIMKPNALGRLVERFWSEIPEHYGHVELGAWQVMPNHFHGLVWIVRSGGAGLGEVLNLFKGSVTRIARKEGLAGSRHGEKAQALAPSGARVWAPNYYDVICFSAEELAVKERYVRANPMRWALKGVPEGKMKRSRFKGNVELLKEPERKSLRISRRATVSVVEELKSGFCSFNRAVFSTFFSAGERECLATLLETGKRVVWVMPMGMPEHIPTKWAETFISGRALWLSAFPDDQTGASRESCEKVNLWVNTFCSNDRY